MKGYILKCDKGYCAGHAMPWFVENINEAIVFPTQEAAMEAFDQGDVIIPVEIETSGEAIMPELADVNLSGESNKGRAKSKTAQNRSLKSEMKR